MKRLKRFLLFLSLFGCLLCGQAYAAVCGEIVASDGGMCRECALGNLGADALRACTGADIALFASGDLGIGLQPGEITEESLAESFPRDRTVVLMTVTAQELRALLEEELSHVTLNSEEMLDEEASAWEGFFCVSGFSFSYDASAPAGSRVYDLALETEPLLLAISEDYGEGEPAGTIRQAVAAYCEELETVMPPETDRIRVLGANTNRIVGGYLSRPFIVVAAVIAIIFSGARYRRRLKTTR